MRQGWCSGWQGRGGQARAVSQGRVKVRPRAQEGMVWSKVWSRVTGQGGQGRAASRYRTVAGKEKPPSRLSPLTHPRRRSRRRWKRERKRRRKSRARSDNRQNKLPALPPPSPLATLVKHTQPILRPRNFTADPPLMSFPPLHFLTSPLFFHGLP